MATTTPDLIYSPDNTAGIDQLHTELATMAASVQTAFGTRVIKTYKWANSAAKTAQTGMAAGDEGYQSDTKTAYRYNGTSWRAWDSDWITFTPSSTGINFGSTGTVTAKKRYFAGMVRIEFLGVFGGTGISVADFDFTLPDNMESAAAPFAQVGFGTAFAGANIYPLMVCKIGASVNTVRTYSRRTDATNEYQMSFTGTSPLTWAAGSTLALTIEYAAG